MANNFPKVSVLIPTYNYSNFLDTAIQSVLSQTFTDFELIIVDDVSTDNTDDVVKKYLVDQRVSYHKNLHNHGLPGNWNTCLELAKGKYIKYLMGDDKFHPQLLEKFVSAFENNPNVSLVTSYRQYFNCSASKIVKQDYPPFAEKQIGAKIICESLYSGNWLGEPTTVMFKRSNLHLGKFDTNYSWIPDWDMWLRQLTTGDCYIIPEVLSFFRLHEKQATVSLTKNFKRNFEEYFFYKKVRDDNPYNIHLSPSKINKIVKQKAGTYIKSSIKGLAKFGVQQHKLELSTARTIFFKERLFLTPLYLLPSVFIAFFEELIKNFKAVTPFLNLEITQLYYTNV